MCFVNDKTDRVKNCINTGQSEHDALPSKRVVHEVGGVSGFPSSLYE